jgi:hypothetical protein
MFGPKCEGSHKIMMCIKHKNTNMNYQNENGDTPFHTYVKMHSIAFIARETKILTDCFLERKDFNLHLKNKEGKTVFDLIQEKEKNSINRQKHIENEAKENQKQIKKDGDSLKRKLSNLLNPLDKKKRKI